MLSCSRGVIRRSMEEHSINLRTTSESSTGRKRTQDALDRAGATLKKYFATHEHPRGMLGKTHTEEERKNIMERQLGEKSHWHGKRGKNHPRWKGGYSKTRDCADYREWRTSVFEKDDYTCRFCKDRGGELNAHHIRYYSKCEDLRYNINNGATLCKPCHDSLHGDRIRIVN